jgi:hypothetical protein
MQPQYLLFELEQSHQRQQCRDLTASKMIDVTPTVSNISPII